MLQYEFEQIKAFIQHQIRKEERMKTLARGILLLVFPACFSCSSNSYSGEDPRISSSKHLSMVEKAWTARHHYDPERRLLVPKVAGARWGSTQEYKEDGTLTYRDWWVRDIKMEDLEPAPSMFVDVILEEDEAISTDARGNLDTPAPIQGGLVEGETEGGQEFAAPESSEPIPSDPFSAAEPAVEVLTESEDPFTPVAEPSTDSNEPEVSPFAPLELPF